MNLDLDELLENCDDEAVDKNLALLGGKRARFRRIPFLSALHREAAWLALRMISRRRWYSRILEDGRFQPSSILPLIGLEQHPFRTGITSDMVRELVGLQLQHLGVATWPQKDRLQHNIDQLGTLLHLNDCERLILRACVVMTNVCDLNNLFYHMASDAKACHAAVGGMIAQSASKVGAALNNSSLLRRCGIFHKSRFDFERESQLDINDFLCEALLSSNRGELGFLSRLVRRAPKATLVLDDFRHIPALGTAHRYMESVCPTPRKGVNVLLYGPPGTGKTEFARALAAALKRDLYEVPNVDKEGEAISGRKRFATYAFSQSILSHRPGQMLLFDEVEDVFGGGGGLEELFGLRFGSGPDSLRKSWVNETLETNPVPTIWACNSIRAMDRAYLRRFDLIVEMKAPGREVRRRMLARYFRKGQLSTACAERIADIEALPPAQIARAAKVLRALKCPDVEQRDQEVLRMLESSLRAMGMKCGFRHAVLPSHYDPAFINTTADLDSLAKGLARRGSGRLCLYGPPGTGKTAFAHHLGRVLDRPVLVKRGSDLMNMFVGETEKEIANAFAQAQIDNAILVIDEADGFLRDRAGAGWSWEVAQVNELLTQMEAFEGIFVASTNLIDTMDAASLRRFDFKLKFDYLNRDQRRALVAKACVTDKVASEAAWSALDRLHAITPGDVANALRQCVVTGEAATVDTVIQLLEAEQAIKPECRSKRIGFVR